MIPYQNCLENFSLVRFWYDEKDEVQKPSISLGFLCRRKIQVPSPAWIKGVINMAEMPYLSHFFIVREYDIFACVEFTPSM